MTYVSISLSAVFVVHLYLWVKIDIVVALDQHVDFSLHFLILLKCCLLVSLIIQQHSKIEIYQGIRPKRDWTELHLVSSHSPGRGSWEIG